MYSQMLGAGSDFTHNFKAYSADSLATAPEKHAHNNQHHLHLPPKTLSPLSSGKQQRHSTGNLNTEEPEDADLATLGSWTRPTKGILKRPHTFHRDRKRPQEALFKYQPPLQHMEMKATQGKHSKTATVVAVDESQRMPVHVEFSDMNAVTVFGDTTTDTEGGGAAGVDPATPNKLKFGSPSEYQNRKVEKASATQNVQQNKPADRKRTAPPSAIVSPFVRPHKNSTLQQQQQRQQHEDVPSFPPQSHGPSPAEASSGDNSGGNRNSNVSHIVGKWWFGPSTKFVVHCDHRGHHRHGGSPANAAGGGGGGQSREGTPAAEAEEQSTEAEAGHQLHQPYLTPTQRKQQEIGALKKELRRTQLASRDKDRHLGQLRDRLAEIERMMASSTNAQMVQCAQLRQRMAEQAEEFVVEREALMARHEHKVRQLVQETVDLRAEMARKEKALADKDRIQRRDQATQVFDEFEGAKSAGADTASTASTIVPTAAVNAAGWFPAGCQFVDQQIVIDRDPGAMIAIKEDASVGPATANNPETAPNTVPMPLVDGAGSVAVVGLGLASQSAPVSPCKAPLVKIGAEVMATLEAYRAETVVWRTRCANLELIMQDLLLREGVRAGQNEGGIASALFINLEGVGGGGGGEEMMMEAREQGREWNGPAGALEKRLSSSSQPTTREPSVQPTLSRKPTTECQLPGCADKKRKLAEENELYREQKGKLVQELDALKAENADTERRMHKFEFEIAGLLKEHNELGALAETRLCESKAIKLTLQGVQAERDKLDQALNYLERRCQALELIGLDQGIVLAEDSCLDDIVGIGAFRGEFTVRGSKATQTMLTVDALGCNEREMSELQIRLRVMQSTFAEDKAQMQDQLLDIERVLGLKTQLVTKLTGQLDEAARESRAEDERHQFERDAFTERVEELGRVAQRVPILESEIERAMSEKSRSELRLREVEEQLEEALDVQLDTTLASNRIREEYWRERLDTVDRERKEVKALLELNNRRLADEQLKWSLEKAELDRRLTSAIQHVSLLNSRLNCPRRDAQCDVRPRTMNKYVSCRPNQKDQAIGADLRDEEVEELNENLGKLADERELLLSEIALLEAEAEKATAELIQRGQLSQAHKRRPADYLTVSFRRKGELVEFSSASRMLEGPSATTTKSASMGDSRISIVSLPTVLEEHPTKQMLLATPYLISGGKRGREGGIGRATDAERVPSSTAVITAAKTTKIRSNSLRSSNSGGEEGGTEFLMKDAHRELSLPPPRHMVSSGTKLSTSLLRCHSAPRRQELGGGGSEPAFPLEQKQHPQLLAVQQLVSKLQVPKIQITYAEEVRERVLAFRLRVQELLTTAQTREIPTSVEEAELFDELDTWLRALAENEKRSWEAQQRAEELRRQRDRLREQLKDAELELWIYRTEPRRAAVERAEAGWRSCSAEHLGHNGPPLAAKQLKRWKEVAGTCFREVNQLRRRLASVEDERLALWNQATILKGELAMTKAQAAFELSRLKRAQNSLDDPEAIGETLKSYNRWLGGDRWQSVPDLDEAMMMEEQRKKRRPGRGEKRKNVEDEKDRHILNEALRVQLARMREERDRLVQLEQGMAEKLCQQQRAEEELRFEHKKVKAECELLKRENSMYEQKCVDMDRDRQQMYLVMFRKGQQAANQAMDDELDKTAELQIVLRFLHDAFFYYLLSKGNAREHLQAIMTMLSFTPEQKEEVYKRRGKSH